MVKVIMKIDIVVLSEVVNSTSVIIPHHCDLILLLHSYLKPQFFFSGFLDEDHCSSNTEGMDEDIPYYIFLLRVKE